MVVFDLTHDRMAQVPFAVVADVQAALIFDESRYQDAGRKIGLTPAEFNEFEERVFDGAVQSTVLPTRIDAMAGMHRGHIYALRNIHVRPGEHTFVIALADGKRVYVPMRCGNLSFVKGAPKAAPVHVVAHHAVPAPHRPAAPRVAVVAEQTPAPMVAAINAPVARAAAPVAAVAARHHSFALPFFAWLAGTIDHTVYGGGGGTQPPPCTAGTISDAGGCGN